MSTFCRSVKYDAVTPEIGHSYANEIKIPNRNRIMYSEDYGRHESGTTIRTESLNETPHVEPRATIGSLSNANLLPSATAQNKEHRAKHRSLSGWRIGALLALIGTMVVFIFNLVFTIWVARNPKYHMQNGIGTLFEGSCAKTRRLNVWAHVLVNALSTLLLCASNYCMQVLCSPNREEVDHAHAQRFWLHIGIPSFHNLKHIKRERSILWAMLMLSSMPLHLLYNSIVFTNTQANNYVVVPAMDDWLFGGNYNFTNFLGFDDNTDVESTLNSYRPTSNETVTLNNGTVSPRYKNISAEDCFHSFDTQYAPELGNVYIAQDKPTTWRNQSLWHYGMHDDTQEYFWFLDDETNRTLRFYVTRFEINSTMPFRSDPNIYPSNGWRCPPFQNSTCDFPNASEGWKPYESSVRYCLVERVAEICKLQFSFLIVSIILATNLVKATCISRLLFCHSSHDALVTLGDALASFLEHPDIHTVGRCLPAEVHIDRAFDPRRFGAPPNDIVGYSAQDARELENRPRAFRPKKIRWSASSSSGMWFTTYLFFVGAIVFGLLAISRSTRDMPNSLALLWKIGFGTVDGRNLLTTKMSIISGVMLANSPQALLSYLYVSFNRLYTSMLLGKEWSSYLHERKTLRVTNPVGQQRSTYWLSVPYRYAIPMLIVSGLFHWLASQSLFMVQISVTRTQGSGPREVIPTDRISTCGFSPFAIILATVTATTVALGGILMGRLKYPAGMPLAGSCSSLMSAACHPLPGDENAYMLPVQWGAVVHGFPEDDCGDMEVGHCTFSSGQVGMPISGRFYA